MLVGNLLTKIQNNQVKDIFLKAIYQFIHPSDLCHYELCKAYKKENEMNKTKPLLSCRISLPGAEVFNMQIGIQRRAASTQNGRQPSLCIARGVGASGTSTGFTEEGAAPYQAGRKFVGKRKVEATPGINNNMCKGMES